MKLNRRQFLGTTAGVASVSSLQARARPAVPPAPDDEADPLGVRADFPVVTQGVYLNSAYIAPNPRVGGAGRLRIRRGEGDETALAR